MGNTILAHALYSCSKLIIDPDILFSLEGNAHAINNHNKTNLISWHCDEYPRSDVKIVMKILCKDWDELLRLKMSYSKYWKKLPNVGNFSEFGFTDAVGSSWLENLTMKYWTMFQNNKMNSAHTMSEIVLGEYLSGNTNKLQCMTEQQGWHWDLTKSNNFYKIMLQKNAQYFDWLITIKSIVANCLENKFVNINLEFWEKAITIAKVCDMSNINPQLLHWNTEEYFVNNNLSLINSLKRLKHGQTI